MSVVAVLYQHDAARTRLCSDDMGGRKGTKAADETVVRHQTDSHDHPRTTRKRKATHDPDQSNSETNTYPECLKESKPGVQQDSENGYLGPYPQLVRPTAQECQVRQQLGWLGNTCCGNAAALLFVVGSKGWAGSFTRES